MLYINCCTLQHGGRLWLNPCSGNGASKAIVSMFSPKCCGMTSLALDHVSPLLSHSCVLAAANMSGILKRHSPEPRCHATVNERDSRFPSLSACLFFPFSLLSVVISLLLLTPSSETVNFFPLLLVVHKSVFFS